MGKVIDLEYYRNTGIKQHPDERLKATDSVWSKMIWGWATSKEQQQEYLAEENRNHLDRERRETEARKRRIYERYYQHNPEDYEPA